MLKIFASSKLNFRLHNFALLRGEANYANEFVRKFGAKYCANHGKYTYQRNVYKKYVH